MPPVWGGSRFTWLALYLPAVAVGSAGRRLMQSELALGAAAGIAVGAALFLRPQLRAAAASTWARLRPPPWSARRKSRPRGLELRAEANTATQLASRDCGRAIDR